MYDSSDPCLTSLIQGYVFSRMLKLPAFLYFWSTSSRDTTTVTTEDIDVPKHHHVRRFYALEILGLPRRIV